MESQFNQDKWSDKFNWKMDLLKSAIAYFVVTIVTICVFTFGIDRTQHKWESKYGLKLETFKDYERASNLYILMSHDAIKDQFLYGKDSANQIEKWQDEGYDNLKIAEESLTLWFQENDCTCGKDKKLTSLLNKFDSTKNDLMGLYRSIKCNNNIQPDTLRILWNRFDSLQVRPGRKLCYIINDTILKIGSELLEEN